MRKIRFQSLLDEKEPHQEGLFDEKSGFVHCLCGCGGCFEPEDFEEIKEE